MTAPQSQQNLPTLPFHPSEMPDAGRQATRRARFLPVCRERDVRTPPCLLAQWRCTRRMEATRRRRRRRHKTLDRVQQAQRRGLRPTPRSTRVLYCISHAKPDGGFLNLRALAAAGDLMVQMLPHLRDATSRAYAAERERLRLTAELSHMKTLDLHLRSALAAAIGVTYADLCDTLAQLQDLVQEVRDLRAVYASVSALACGSRTPCSNDGNKPITTKHGARSPSPPSLRTHPTPIALACMRWLCATISAGHSLAMAVQHQCRSSTRQPEREARDCLRGCSRRPCQQARP
mmetsp:Transcript_17812/g.51790  ORF Transcript_17812/g.51790 Transcript_17812/m.51790 type:complete len:290 (+) Transcript_17812:233-1102(+)